jgi:hypothetical protein
MKFKPGQEVTPKIKAGEWATLLDTPNMPFPEFGKVYTVFGYPNPQFPEMLKLEEIKGNFLYWEDRFEALVPAEKMVDDLEEVVSLDEKMSGIHETLRHLIHG